MRKTETAPVAYLVKSAVVAIGLAFAPTTGASAYTLKLLHSFCAWSNCGDGKSPYSGLLMDQSGNLYGTANLGGKHAAGTAFKLLPNADKTAFSESDIHNFCARTNCTDGKLPTGDLIVDSSGNLYGTTVYGGKNGSGVVFKLTHGPSGWTLSVIHNFCASYNCPDGSEPFVGLTYTGQAAGAPWDQSSPLFGTAALGGTYGNGIVYELTPPGSKWTFKIIHSFKAFSGSAGPGPLVMDTSGNLFGVTQQGAKFGYGALYKLAAGTWKETTLHNFCAEMNCADGRNGAGRLLMDATGDLFGGTFVGGNCPDFNSQTGCGIIFEHRPGIGYGVIYDFCPVHGCADGLNPNGGLAMDGAGNLFGTTRLSGNAAKAGTVFELSPGANNTYSEQTLYTFCSEANCTDGAAPNAPMPLLIDPSGALLGTTLGGGANGDDGTVFELTP